MGSFKSKIVCHVTPKKSHDMISVNFNGAKTLKTYFETIRCKQYPTINSKLSSYLVDELLKSKKTKMSPFQMGKMCA